MFIYVNLMIIIILRNREKKIKIGWNYLINIYDKYIIVPYKINLFNNQENQNPVGALEFLSAT